MSCVDKTYHLLFGASGHCNFTTNELNKNLRFENDSYLHTRVLLLVRSLIHQFFFN